MWTRVIITSNTSPESWYIRLTDEYNEYVNEEEKEWRKKESNAFDRRITLRVDDIDEKASYPQCLALVSNKVAQAGLNKSQDKGESWSEGTVASILEY